MFLLIAVSVAFASAVVFLLYLEKSPKAQDDFFETAAAISNTRNINPEVELTACTIHWPDKKAYTNIRELLVASGFSPAGQFQLEGKKIQMEIWLNRDEAFTFYLYLRLPFKMQMSIATQYVDGSSVDFSNAPETGMKKCPELLNVYCGNIGAEELLQHARRERKSGARVSSTPETVVEDFKRSWRRWAEWRQSVPKTPEEMKSIQAALVQRRKVKS